MRKINHKQNENCSLTFTEQELQNILEELSLISLNLKLDIESKRIIKNIQSQLLKQASFKGGSNINDFQKRIEIQLEQERKKYQANIQEI